jgi:hypothetical protein
MDSDANEYEDSLYLFAFALSEPLQFSLSNSHYVHLQYWKDWAKAISFLFHLAHINLLLRVLPPSPIFPLPCSVLHSLPQVPTMVHPPVHPLWLHSGSSSLGTVPPPVSLCSCSLVWFPPIYLCPSSTESIWESDMVVHAYNPSTRETEQEDWKFEAILSYIVLSCI